MANENKNKKTETTLQGAPHGAAKSVQFPVLKDGSWVCSDGFMTSDAYIARQHEKTLK